VLSLCGGGRLTDGSTLKHEFNGGDRLLAVHDFIARHRTDGYTSALHETRHTTHDAWHAAHALTSLSGGGEVQECGLRSDDALPTQDLWRS
jgi:hypothetical protein